MYRSKSRYHLDSYIYTKLIKLRLTAQWLFPQITKEYPTIPLLTIKSTIYTHQKRGYINKNCTGRGHKPILNKEEHQ
jgi:hypothetical protein